MYCPAKSSETDHNTLVGMMRRIGVATLVTPTPEGIHATQVPVLMREVEEGRLILAAHVARANPHWRAAREAPSIAIFQGPHAYMSPAWYPTKQETGKVVPTWLYVSIHAHGRLKAVQDDVWLRQQVGDLVDVHEAGREQPWQVSDAPESYITGMARGIVGLEFAVDRLEGVWKLNEEENDADLRGTLRGLEAGAPAAQELAKELLGRTRH
ncbi:FMN-binding negative transcriptional regulator [Antarctobacter sp.]|uniref:FMN-binding negative transcriptional regulator n=1 Tax=Antarctobacter sp. TaxID=1872577 RepID=UPI003A94B63B